ncbi:TPA: hypothetical protein QHQ55_002577 [Escherichia coli]|nr:hypothetical protein [Escherichia coli]
MAGLDLSPDQLRYSSNCSNWARANFTANANAVSQSPENYFFCILFRYNNFQIQPDQMINISGSLDKKSAPAVVRVTQLQK